MCQFIRFLKKVKLSQDLKNVTSQGGLILAARLIFNMGLHKVVDPLFRFKKRLRGFSESHFLFSMILGFLSGAQNLEDFRLFHQDHTLRQLLGGFSFPSPSCLHKLFQRVSLGQIRQLKKVFWFFYERLGKPMAKRVTLDIDGSLIEVFGKKEGSRHSYKKILSYHPLFAFLGETFEMVGLKLRPGNVPSLKGFYSFLEEIVGHLRKKAKQIIVRMDAGFFSHEVVDTLERQGLGYIVGAYKRAEILQAIWGIQSNVWQSYRHGREVAEFVFQSKGWRCQRPYRYIVMRKEKPPYAQLDLFEGQYDYHVVVTNLDWSAKRILDHYFKRGQCENLIREYKNGFGLRHLPFKRFMANWAYMIMGQMAYNFSLWLKEHLLPIGWKPFSIKSLRFRLFHQPAKIIHLNKKPEIQFSTDHPWFEELKYGWDRIEKLAA